MTRHPLILASILWLIALGVALPPSARALNLDGVLKAAREHDLRYAESGAHYRVARTALPAATSAFFPKIQANANVAYNDLHNTILGASAFPIPSGTFTFNSHGYGISLRETLLDIRALYAYHAAGEGVHAARLRYQLAASRLMLGVARRYFAFLLARDDLRLIHAEERALHAEYRSALRSFHLGTATIIDAHEARARFDTVRAEGLSAANTLRIARDRLERMTGHAVRHVWRLALTKPLPAPPRVSLQGLEARAALQNLVLRAQQAQAHSASAAASAAQAARFPTISAEASYSYEHAGNGIFGFGSNLRQKIVGLNLSWPIYQGGELRAASAKARAQAYGARLAVLRARRIVRFDVRRAFLTVHSGYAQIVAFRTAEKAARVALASDELGARVGTRNTVDVLEAEQAYYAARRDYTRSVYGYLLSRLGLKAAVSHLTPGDIRQLNGLLRPPRGHRSPRRVAPPHP